MSDTRGHEHRGAGPGDEFAVLESEADGPGHDVPAFVIGVVDVQGRDLAFCPFSRPVCDHQGCSPNGLTTTVTGLRWDDHGYTMGLHHVLSIRRVHRPCLGQNGVPAMGTGTEEYYRHWAPDYDEVYTRPERQGDMLVLRGRLTDWFAGKHVLELAAGTGWWTSVLANTAASVTATDVNQATLDVARARRDWPSRVDFVVADAFGPHAIRGDFDAVFAGFFWSHIPLTT